MTGFITGINGVQALNGIKVSVVVPIYNVKDFLNECLDSLVRQSLQGIEVIMVNDGSTDGSELIAAGYADKYPGFRLINRVNGGLSAARNTGLEAACGEYVCFLDSDDYLADHALEMLYSKASDEDLDQIRFGANTFIDGDSCFENSSDISTEGYVYRGRYPSVCSGSEFYRMAIDNADYYPCVYLFLIRRIIIVDNDLKFYEGIFHEDELFNLQATSLCSRVAVLHDRLYYRRFRPGSIVTTSNHLKKLTSMCISAEEADRFADSHPSVDLQSLKWLNWYFFLFMMQHWENLTPQERKIPEVTDCFRRIRPLIKKYGNTHLSYRLFYISKPLYRAYKRLKNLHLIRKMKDSIMVSGLKRKIKHDPHLLFWVLTPVHENIGDQAIALAEQRMLISLGVKYCEVTDDMLGILKEKNALGIFNGNPVLFHGGGYLGTLWFNEEELVRELIAGNPDSPMLFMPNTLYFDDDRDGLSELQKSAESYGSNKKLKIYAREKKSHDMLIKMGVSAGIAPDSVMSLKADDVTANRSGCLLLLRSDCEKTRTYDDDKKLLKALGSVFGDNITRSDTVVYHMISVAQREAEVNDFLSKVRGSELVVTDRLHGMVLSAVTGTPCIVLNSRSHKVRCSYEWLKDLDYIRFCDEPDRIAEIYDDMPHGGQVYDNSRLSDLYSELKEDILRLVK